MTKRRLAIYLLIDVALWALALWLLCGDPTHTRLAFWYHAHRTSSKAAMAFGKCSIRCELRYTALARNAT